MRKTLITFFLIITCCSYSQRDANQSIHYYNETAGQVFMVWGIDNWQLPEKKRFPKGSYVNNGLVYTPMNPDDEGIFVCDLRLKAGTKIDYVFWITQGPQQVPCDVWDLNSSSGKDYHTTAFNDNITRVNSRLIVKPKQQLSILDYSWAIFIILLVLGAVAYTAKRFVFKDVVLKPGPVKIILGTGGVVLFSLFLTRASVSLLGWDLYYHPLDSFPKLLSAGFYDHLYVVVLTFIFLTLFFLFRKYNVAKKVIISVFVFLGIFSIICSILNIRVVELIGKPFNFRWLVYSGFLKSADSKAAMEANVSSSYIMDVIIISLATVVAGILVIYILEYIFLRFKLKKLTLASFVVLNIGYALIAGNTVNSTGTNYDKLANPITAFIGSLDLFAEKPVLYTMEVPDSLEMALPKTFPPDQFNFPKSIKNVIVLVLESTAAEYVQPYDKKYKITPELEKQLPNAVVFDNIYAHAPATNKSMVCLLGSMYPWLSYNSITAEHPGINIPTIPSELKKCGYRTAFFNSADNDFQRAEEFLSHRKLDEIMDCKEQQCAKRFDEKNSKEPLDGVNDECTADAMLKWINTDNSKPFFTMMWTYQTHYPYYADSIKSYADHDSVFNRYLNAVHHSDKVLGRIIKELHINDLAGSTLIVIVGDHGEAFGRHDQITHASKIYEENVHIPLIFIHPDLKGENKPTIGGMVDVAPTIMAMLGQKQNSQWQGRNLFAPVTNPRTYFFCPWSDQLFGYREGNRKYIYNATKDESEIYDLEKDPYETNNLARNEKEIALYHQKLAAWIQYQEKYMENIIGQKLN